MGRAALCPQRSGAWEEGATLIQTQEVSRPSSRVSLGSFQPEDKGTSAPPQASGCVLACLARRAQPAAQSPQPWARSPGPAALGPQPWARSPGPAVRGLTALQPWHVSLGFPLVSHSFRTFWAFLLVSVKNARSKNRFCRLNLSPVLTGRR